MSKTSVRWGVFPAGAKSDEPLLVHNFAQAAALLRRESKGQGMIERQVLVSSPGNHTLYSTVYQNDKKHGRNVFRNTKNVKLVKEKKKNV